MFRALFHRAFAARGFTRSTSGRNIARARGPRCSSFTATRATAATFRTSSAGSRRGSPSRRSIAGARGERATTRAAFTARRCTGHIVRGLSDEPDQLLFRQIFLDTAELARIVMGFDEVDAERVGARGASQGGALTLACAALEPRIRRAAPVYPFLCDYQRVWEMDLAKDAYAELRQFFRRHDPTHEHEAEWFRRLGYIDVQHLAPRIQGDVMMAIGLMDTVCPPSSPVCRLQQDPARRSRACSTPTSSTRTCPAGATANGSFSHPCSGERASARHNPSAEATNGHAIGTP